MDIYNLIFYILIFIIGSVFGSFYTLAVYRVPRKEDITHSHSYCPNCNHKLGFFDLIPIFSYIFLGGKCRYCGKKIRPRYLILEILSGLTFLLFAYITKFNLYNLRLEKIAEFLFATLYFTFIVLIAGTDKENRRIEKSITIYGIAIALVYIVYLCIVNVNSIYRYVIYLMFYIILLILDNLTLKKYARNSYTDNILFTVITMAIFTGEYVTTNSIILVLLIIFIYMLVKKLVKRTKKYRKKIGKEIEKEENLPIGFYLGVANILNLIFVLLYNKMLMLK